MKSSVRRGNLLRSSALIALLVTVAANTANAADPTYQFNIPAESLSQALTDFSQASSQQIIYTEDLVRGRKSAGLHGSYTAEQALEALLAGTGLKVQVNAAGVMMVQSKNAQAASNEAASAQSVETVTVTGSHLRSVEALTPVTTITSTDLNNQGYVSLSDAIEQLPQNFKGGVSSQSSPVTAFGSGQNNYSFANGINLRGLGPNDTLVLLNGRRLPPTALDTTIDISGIPVSAIDRVEILDDGASAVYGSDAVAGVVNIITKKSYDGAEAGLRLDTISDGKQPNYGGYALAGFDWNGGGIIVDYDYEKQNPLPASARSFTNTVPNPSQFYLTPQQETSSYYGSLNQQFTSSLQLSADAIYSSRAYAVNSTLFGPASNAGRDNQFAGNAELDYAAFADWTFSLVGQLGTETDNSIVNATGYTVQGPYNYRVESVEARGDGSVISLPGGDVRLAGGVSERHDFFSANVSACSPACTPYIVESSGDRVFSAYGEILIPIVGPDNSVPLIQKLRLDAAVRYDHYSTFGDTTNPKITLQWIPVDDVSLHGSYATSFKAPTLYQTAPSGLTYGLIYAANPQDPNSENALEIYNFQNPDLKPETAVTYNAGATYNPRFVKGLSLEASYFNINYTNEIETLADTFIGSNLLNGQLGSLVNLNPTASQINAAVNAASASGGLTCYSAVCTNSSIKVLANLGIQNAASVQVEGLDFDSKYTFDSGFGQFAIDADGSYFLRYSQLVTPTASPAPGTGVVYLPARFRTKVNAGWNLDSWTANLRMNFTSSEKNPSDPNCLNGCQVTSWTTFDASASYAFREMADLGFLNGTQLRLDITNIFDRAPPYVNQLQGLNYDGVNASPLGRSISVSLTKRF